MPEPEKVSRDEFIKRLNEALKGVFHDLPDEIVVHESNPLLEIHDPRNGKLIIHFTLDVLVDKTWEANS